MHKILNRILRKHPDAARDEAAFENLLSSLSSYFDQYDEDRSLLERSLTLTSDELNQINEQLSGQLNENIQKKTELEKSLVKLQALFDVSPEAIVVIDGSGRIDQINPAGCELFSLTLDEILILDNKQLLKKWLALIKNSDTFFEKMKDLENNKTTQLFGTIEFKNGKHYEYFSIPEIVVAH